MNFFQRIKELLGLKIVSQDTLRNTCDNLQLNIGFANVRQSLIKKLDDVAKDENSKLLFAFLGQQGLGKTIVARDVLTDFLFSIGRTQRQSFLKVEPYKLDKTAFENAISSKIVEGKGGVIFIDEVHNLREVETTFFNLLISTIKLEEYQKTAFVISAGVPSWKRIKDKFPGLTTFFTQEVYFEPYNDEQLAEILKEVIHNDNETIKIPQPSRLVSLVRELRFIRKRQGQYFENASEIMFYYHKCLKKAAIYHQKDILDEDLERSSLRNFSSTVVRR